MPPRLAFARAPRRALLLLQPQLLVRAQDQAALLGSRIYKGRMGSRAFTQQNATHCDHTQRAHMHIHTHNARTQIMTMTHIHNTSETTRFPVNLKHLAWNTATPPWHSLAPRRPPRVRAGRACAESRHEEVSAAWPPSGQHRARPQMSHGSVHATRWLAEGRGLHARPRRARKLTSP